MFLGQAGMFLSFQARCSSAMRSSTSDLTVVCKLLLCFLSACINVALDALERDEAYEKGEVAFCSFWWFIILPIVVEFTMDACCLVAIQYDCTAICQRSGNGLKLYWQLFGGIDCIVTVFECLLCNGMGTNGVQHQYVYWYNPFDTVALNVPFVRLLLFFFFSVYGTFHFCVDVREFRWHV